MTSKISLFGFLSKEVCVGHGMLDNKPFDSPMDPNVKLIHGQVEPLTNPGRYRRLIRKLNYITITCLNISIVYVVSQFLQSPYDSHSDAAIWILQFFKGSLGHLLYEKKGHSRVVGYSDAD